MNRYYKSPGKTPPIREQIIGLGESSARKSHYPELQQRLRELERFQILINLSADFFFIIEIPSGRIVDVNDTVLRHVGRPRAHLLSLSILEVLEIGDPEYLHALARRPPAPDGSRCKMAARLVICPSRPCPLLEIEVTSQHIDGRLYAILVGRDVSSRLDAERAVKKSRERLNLALEGADMGIWDWNVQTGEIFFDDRWASILGYRKSDISPSLATWQSLVHPDDYPHFMSALGAHLYGRAPHYEAEYRMKASDGEWIWILDRGKIVEYDGDGRPLRAIGTHLNITEKKRLGEQLNQAQKMESIGQLAGGIAHDFNNLLTVIHGQAEIGSLRLREDDPLLPRLKAILDASRRAANLTGQLLAFSRKQMFRPKVLDINQTLMEFDNMLGRLISEDIQLHKELAENLPFIKADPVQLEQILMNLVINARDAINERRETGSERVIHISTWRLVRDAGFAKRHPAATAGEYVVISIRDTGVGMSPEVQARIFDPFFTTKEQGKGTGLGLATVYGIVGQNQGLVEVTSELGRGSEFRIIWPACVEKDQREEGSSLSAVAVGTERILFVEDDRAVRQFGRDALLSYGYRVETAANGREALDMLRVDPEYAMIVTDVIMPEINGVELAREVEKRYPAIRLLLVSGYPGDQVADSGVLEDRFHFMRKPYSARQLAEAIRRILG